MHAYVFAPSRGGTGPLLYAVVLLGCALFAWTGRAGAAAGDTEVISPGDMPALSSDARYVAFRWDGNADPQGYFTYWDAYLRDRLAGVTTRISTDATHWEPHDEIYWDTNVAVSANGRFVAFMSRTFLIGYVPQYRVLLRDRQAGTTEVVASFLGPGPDERFDAGSGSVAISADGRFVVFDSASGDLVSNDTNGVVDVFVHDRTTKAIERASVGTGGAQGNEGSFAASITPNGRYVAFWSDASNLVTADTNNIHDVFVRDRQTGVTQRVSVDSEERQVIGPGSAFGRTAPAISSGARFVAFYSDAANLVPGDADGLNDVFVRDRVAGTTERINSGPGGSAVCGGRDCAVSLNAADGRYVAFVTSAPLVRGDNNGEPDVYVHDRWMDRVEIASVRNNGRQLPAGVQPSLSADGRFVAFHGYGPEWFANERVYLHELGGTDIWDYRVVGGRDFGAQPVGTTGTSRIYSVQNRGSVVLTIERLELRGTDAANFRLSSQCGATLAVGASCNVRVTFVPRSVGMKSAKLAAVFALREGTGAFTKTLLGTGT